MLDSRHSRRGFLAGAVACGSVLISDEARAATPSTQPAVRFAHLTDIHVQPELAGGEGFAAALQSLSKLDPQPSFIITGGDHIMDACQVTRQRCDVQWNLYESTLRQNTTLPVHPLIGNHDVWGWSSRAGAAPTDRGYGKAMAMDRLGMKSRFYSFDAGGWHFVCLDSITQRGEAYLAALDAEQAEWLAADLKQAGTTTPICIISHIPVLCVCGFFDFSAGERTIGNFWTIPDAWMHRDAGKLVDLLMPYRVPLLLSGHIHMVDRVDYLGKSYICDGAVCGNFWRGRRMQFAEGYGVIDLFADGTFQHQYITYGWKART